MYVWKHINRRLYYMKAHSLMWYTQGIAGTTTHTYYAYLLRITTVAQLRIFRSDDCNSRDSDSKCMRGLLSLRVKCQGQQLHFDSTLTQYTDYTTVCYKVYAHEHTMLTSTTPRVQVKAGQQCAFLVNSADVQCTG